MSHDTFLYTHMPVLFLHILTCQDIPKVMFTSIGHEQCGDVHKEARKYCFVMLLTLRRTNHNLTVYVPTLKNNFSIWINRYGVLTLIQVNHH